MGQIFVNTTIKQDRQKTFAVGNFKDSLGNPAVVDGGIQEVTVDIGYAEAEASSIDPMQLTIKSDIATPATVLPSTSQVRFFIDTKVGDGVEKMEFIVTTTTIPAEAVTAELSEVSDEPRA